MCPLYNGENCIFFIRSKELVIYHIEVVLLQVKPVTLAKVKLSIGVFIPHLSHVSSFQNVKFTEVLDTNSNPVPTNKIQICKNQFSSLVSQRGKKNQAF